MATSLKVQLLREGARAPAYASAGAAGLDLYALLPAPVVLEPGKRAMIPTGVAMALPKGHEGQVRSRSGLAARNGIAVLNAPGTIDEDYRGEVKVLLINHGQEPFVVATGERIAQLVVSAVANVTLSPVESLDQTARGQGGFGSTGR